MFKIQNKLRQIFFKRKHPILELYDSLKQNESLSLKELRQLQLEKLNRLLSHAVKNVPYYKEILSSTTYTTNDKIELSSLDDLSNLPLLDKRMIKANKNNLYAEDHSNRRSFVNASGGSTGVPTKVLQDENYLIAEEAGLVQIKNWRSVGPFDSEIFIWGSPRDTFEDKKPLRAYLGDFVRNRIMLNCFNMTPDDIERYIKLLNHHRPAMVRCYVDAIYEIARYARKKNIKVVPQNVIHTGAGNLFDYMRDEIETVFSCKVFDHYGGREVGHIASECSYHNGMHLFMEHNIVELLDENNNPVPEGCEGELVITNLNNYSMPLIRYRIGDLGIMSAYSQCQCGCAYPKLKEVTGRVGDVFKTATGQLVSPVFFAHLIGVVAGQTGIEQYQVIQKEINKIILKLKPEDEQDNIQTDLIIEKIKELFGNETEIEIEVVNNIAKTPSGKYRYTISEVNI